jgi:hypothetical protein
MEDLESRIQLISQLIKTSLEEFDLYIAVDSKTEEFMFLDRKAYEDGKAKLGRVKMNEINVRK